MSNRIVPSGFVKSVLQNGVGRYVCQLQRVTLRFCKSHGASRGIRDFIENDLLEFTRNNPGVVVYLKPRRHKTSSLVGEYLNGNTISKNVHNCSQAEVCQWLQHLKDQSGQEVIRFRKTWHTDSPSIQGIWTPLTNRPSELNLAEYPSEELSLSTSKEKSATERLLEKAAELRKNRMDS